MKQKAPIGLSRYVPYLYGVVVALLVAHWLTVLLTLEGAHVGASWARWFDMDQEYNVPTATNSLLLALSAVVSFGLCVRAKHIVHRVGWFLFSALFTYLAADELLIIHEQLAEPIRDVLNISGSNPLYHAWVIPASILVMIMVFAVITIRRYYRQLKVFSDTLALVATLAGIVVLIEIAGTFVYPYTAAYRLLMIPIEEGFELAMAVTILRKQLAHWYFVR